MQDIPPATATTGADGLCADEVATRVARGQVNAVEERTSRPLAEIVRANVFTRFNAILGVLGAIVLAIGAWGDSLFLGIVVVNALIGIGQELRAKQVLDRLAVLNAPYARVVRDGVVTEIGVGDVVLDDLVELRAGDQVPADGIVARAVGLEIDESLLTGESDAIAKNPGDPVLSGAIVVAGTGRFQATAVGADAYARRLAAEVKQFTKTRSELVDGTNTLLRWLTWALLVVGPVLLVSQLVLEDDWRAAVIGTVAGLVGMVPEGLVLLTSLAFLLAAVTLARRNVLVQELPAVEGLARVDVVCLDKTGTLTEGEIDFGALLPLVGEDDAAAGEARAALGALADDPNPNATALALGAAIAPPEGWAREATVPFSSARKWSAASFRDKGSWVFGAPEMVLVDDPAGPARRRADELAATGVRVLVLARSAAALAGEALPADLEPMALVTFVERVRPDAGETLAYFDEQGVTLRVISGDNPRTVGAVARQVGLPGGGDTYDARDLPTDQAAAAEVLEQHAVFGRVTPQQKRAMVKALQAKGHVVAMTGDGVNDALALKDADIGVAMGSGAPATRAVAQLVLLDGRFSHMPRVVAEGRRVIANIERVASLFVIKNVYAGVLSIITTVFGQTYPFLPRHLTIVSALTIGIPAFFLALAPNNQRYQPGFLRRVMVRSLPTGVLAAVAIFVGYVLADRTGATRDEARTAATVVIVCVGLAVLTQLSRPWAAWKLGLVASMGGLFTLALLLPPAKEFFRLHLPLANLGEALVVGAAGAAAVAGIWELGDRWLSRRYPPS